MGGRAHFGIDQLKRMRMIAGRQVNIYTMELLLSMEICTMFKGDHRLRQVLNDCCGLVNLPERWLTNSDVRVVSRGYLSAKRFNIAAALCQL